MNEDQELEELRKRRMAELQQAQQETQVREQQEAAAKQQIEVALRQILTQDAWEQWNNVKFRDQVNNTSFAHMAALAIIQAARAGKIRGKINKEQLKQFLGAVSSQTRREIKVKGLSERFRSSEEKKKEDAPPEPEKKEGPENKSELVESQEEPPESETSPGSQENEDQ